VVEATEVVFDEDNVRDPYAVLALLSRDTPGRHRGNDIPSEGRVCEVREGSGQVKVSIDAGGRKVEMESEHGELASLVFLAKNLWIDTKPPEEPVKPEPSPGPAVGFQTSKDAGVPSPMSMGGYGGSYIRDPKA